MNRLGIIAVSGLGMAVICIAAAAALGLSSLGDGDWSVFDGEGNCPAAGGTATSREFAWDGGDSVSISVPATVHYQRGNGTMVVATGNPQLLAHLQVQGGRIEIACRARHHGTLDITLPGRDFHRFKLEGSTDLDLKDLAQDSLTVSVAGRGDITATGKVDDLKVSIAGKGDAHLKDLIAQNVDLDIAGRGDIETSPQDNARIAIAGSGDVKLYSEPKHLDTSIMGSGNVEHLAGKD